MNGCILVADDDPELRQILALILARDGYDVIEAENGEQALERAWDSSPTLILLDVMMPGVDGFDACRRLKNDRRTDGVPVIFISALNDLHSHEEALRLGAEGYLDKPIDPKDLSRRVRTAIQRRGINILFNSASPKAAERMEPQRPDDKVDPFWHAAARSRLAG